MLGRILGLASPTLPLSGRSGPMVLSGMKEVTAPFGVTPVSRRAHP